LRAAIVDGGVAVFNGDRDGEWWDIDSSNQDVQVASDAYICASINEQRRGVGVTNSDGRLAVKVEPKDSGTSDHPDHTVGDGRRGW
jgi:hypothetical protein